MPPEQDFLTEIEQSVRAGVAWDETLGRILTQLRADSGTIHLLGDDGVLHLKAASAGIPQVVLDTIRTCPWARGWPGSPSSAGSRSTRATSRPTRAATFAQARVTGLQGSVVVPILRGADAIGALGVANRSERTFTDAEERLLVEIGRVLATR